MIDEEKDETAGFETTTSDMPVVEAEAGGDDAKPEASAAEAKQSPEADDKAKAEEAVKSGENATAEDGKAEGQEAEEQKGKKQNRVQKRIDEVVREREEAKRRAEAAEKRLADLDKKDDKKPEQAGDTPKEPVESDFDTYDEYLDALDKFDQSQQAEPEKVEPKQAEDQDAGDTVELTDAQRTAMAVIKEKVDQEAEKYSDFEDVALNPEVPITGEMLEALAECDDPTKVMYHLGQNKDLAANIADSSPAQQMREIAKLDLTAEVKPPKPTKTTQAADPISPVGGVDAQQKPVGDMSFAEYEAHMNKAEAEGSKGWA
tara:strand:+ start:444 stop:1394 length:951 start_codon:yes stop_codon:yes gene_type:complete